MSPYEKWSLLITGIGVIVGIGVLAIYKGQLVEMRKATDAAKTSADAAIQAVQMSALIQRPWVSFESIRFTEPTVRPKESSASLLVKWVLRNTGQTPAIHVSVDLALYVLGPEGISAEEKEYELCANPHPPVSDAVPDNTIFPGDKIPNEQRLYFEDEKLTTILEPPGSADLVWFYVVACIHYESWSSGDLQTSYTFEVGTSASDLTSRSTRDLPHIVKHQSTAP